jgi:Protein of unknown function (DUF3887)
MNPLCLLLVLFAMPPRAPMQSPIESSARELVTNFNAGRFDAASIDFNDAMKTQLPPSTLADVKQQANAELGAFRSITSVRQRTDSGFRVIDVLCKYEKGLVTFHVKFDAADRVASVFLDRAGDPPIDPALEAAARGLLKSFGESDFDSMRKRFDDKVLTQLTPEMLAAVRSQVWGKYGEIKSVTTVHQTSDATYRTIELTVSCELSSFIFRVVFDRGGRVAGLKFAPVPAPTP